MPQPRRALLITAALASMLPASLPAQQQTVRGPLAQYWMDIATHSMPGMPEFPGMGALGLLGGQSGGSNAWGNTRGMSPGRWLDLALYVRTRPAGVEGAHAIPPGMQMGPALPLVPFKPAAPLPRERAERTERDYEDEVPEKPSGRILIYWGCSETVRPGQPRIIDLATAGPADFGTALGGRHVPERGAKVGPGYALWPNEKSRNPVPAGASLVGEHAITGDGVPASLKFAIAQQQDFMPRIALVASGALTGPLSLQWPANPHARAHYLHAMGSLGKDMVLWSSAEVPDSGMGLFDYLANPTIDRWINDRLLLPGTETRCAIPSGIFADRKGGDADAGGGMLRMISYGHELNLVHPPRPADPKQPWEQEWAARVRVKATAMSMLGMDMGGGSRRGGASSTSVPMTAPSPAGGSPATPAPGQPSRAVMTPAPQPQPQQQQQEESSLPLPGLPGLPGGAGRAVDVIRGIFGR